MAEPSQFPTAPRRLSIRLRGDLARTPAVVAAAILGCCYAILLAGLGIYLLILFATHQGSVGNQVGYLANRGVGTAIVLALFAGASLAIGAIGAWRGTRGLPIIVPLGAVFLIGAIGEPIDIANGNPLSTNLIGAGVLLLAAVPIVLLGLPRKRTPADGG